MKFDLEGWFPSQADAEDVGMCVAKTQSHVLFASCIYLENRTTAYIDSGKCPTCFQVFWNSLILLTLVVFFTSLIAQYHGDLLPAIQLAPKFQFLWSNLIHRRYMRSWCLPFCPPSHVDILMIWYEQIALYDSDLITPVYPRRKQTGLSFHIDMLLASISPYPQPLDGLHAFSPSIPIKISPSMKQIVPALGFAILDSIWSPSACQSWTNVSQNWRETLKEALVFGGKTCFLWLKVHGWLSQFSTKKNHPSREIEDYPPCWWFHGVFFLQNKGPLLAILPFLRQGEYKELVSCSTARTFNLEPWTSAVATWRMKPALRGPVGPVEFPHKGVTVVHSGLAL